MHDKQGWSDVVLGRHIDVLCVCDSPQICVLVQDRDAHLLLLLLLLCGVPSKQNPSRA